MAFYETFSSLAREKRVILTGVLAGLPLSVSGDFLLVVAQRSLNWLVLHGFGGGITAEWTTGQPGPITIFTSPVTLLLLAVAGTIAGLSVGIFAAALIQDDSLQAPAQAGKISGSPAADRSTAAE
jgi:hypothetical protein